MLDLRGDALFCKEVGDGFALGVEVGLETVEDGVERRLGDDEGRGGEEGEREMLGEPTHRRVA